MSSLNEMLFYEDHSKNGDVTINRSIEIVTRDAIEGIGSSSFHWEDKNGLTTYTTTVIIKLTDGTIKILPDFQTETQIGDEINEIKNYDNLCHNYLTPDEISNIAFITMIHCQQSWNGKVTISSRLIFLNDTELGRKIEKQEPILIK